MSGPNPIPALDFVWQNAIDSWTVQMYAQAMTKATIAARVSLLRQISRELSVSLPDLLPQDLLTWTARKQWHTRVTQRGYHAAIRSFLALARPELADVLPAIKLTLGRPRPISDADYWMAYDRSDERTRLILMLAREASMRRCEIAVASCKDIDADARGLTVHGKGGKDRFVPVTDDLMAHIKHWINTTSSHWMFPGQDDGHLSAMWVGHLAHRALQQAGTLHQLRHSCGTAAYQATHDILAVQQLLGHSSVATTQIYAAAANGAVRHAVEAGAPRRTTRETRP